MASLSFETQTTSPLNSLTRPMGTSGLASGDTSTQPKASFDWAGTGKKVGGALSAIGDVMGGINALSTGKMNAKLSRQYGQESFDAIMSEVKQRVGSYQAQQGASGLVSQSASDVAFGGTAKGAKDAATSRRNFDLQAANQMYEGRMGFAKGLMGAGQSILSMK